jgi:hypothetical protein
VENEGLAFRVTRAERNSEELPPPLPSPSLTPSHNLSDRHGRDKSPRAPNHDHHVQLEWQLEWQLESAF